MTGTEPLLAVEDLHTRFDAREGVVHAVDGVSFTVNEGEIVGIVGESGSGKSATARSLLRLEQPGRITRGSIRFRGTELTTADQQTIRRVRGDGMAMVFQDPTTTLNPVFPVGDQIAEALKVHEEPDTQRLLDYLKVPGFSDRRGWNRHRERAIELMEQVGIADAASRATGYPHEFSGGMRQRAMIAIALAREPSLLVVDEPTTALDVTVQAQILDQIAELRASRGMAVLLITHDLGVVAELTDRVLVVYGGRIVESGPTARVLDSPGHPYTEALLECLPQNTPRQSRLTTIDGDVPEMVGGIDGCPFVPRCRHADEQCLTDPIPTTRLGDEHEAACTRATSPHEEDIDA